jgi:hypothetical protein
LRGSSIRRHRGRLLQQVPRLQLAGYQMRLE